MAGWVERFWQDKRGTSFEGIALSVAVIAVAFVASADMLAYVTKPHEGATMVTAKASAPAIPATTNNVDLDQTPTASLPKLISRSILDPCTGATK